MECFKMVNVSSRTAILECCNLLACAASLAIVRGARRVAVVEPGGFTQFYQVAIVRKGEVCIEELGLGEERAVGEGDVVATTERVSGEYWLELQQRGVVGLVMPPLSGCRRRRRRS